MSDVHLKLEEILGKDRIKENEPLSLHTTFRIGGSAQMYVEVKTIDELTSVVRIAKVNSLPVFVLGSGSNTIISEKGIQGIVIKNNCRKFERRGNTIEAESGVIINQLVRFAIENGLSGLEYNLGLPGTVGGAIAMNSCFPKEKSYVSDKLQSAKLIAKDGTIREVDSFIPDGEVILSVVFELDPKQKELLRQRGEYALQVRTNSQPKGGYVGLTYRNISVSENILKNIKGKRIGMVMISDTDEHFILNLGGASSKDVTDLTQQVNKDLAEIFGIDFRYKIQIVGD